MTQEMFEQMFRLFCDVIVKHDDELFTYAPSCHLIDNCGGYELELHPSFLMWGNEVSCLALMADRLLLSVECRFHSGSIIIR